MIAPAALIGPIPPASQAVEMGPTTSYGDTPGTDPNPECHFAPRLPCTQDSNCPLGSNCNRNDFCVRDAPVACTTNADCSGGIAPDFCRTTLWISDHLGGGGVSHSTAGTPVRRGVSCLDVNPIGGLRSCIPLNRISLVKRRGEVR